MADVDNSDYTVPPMKKVDAQRYYDYRANVVDYEDLQQLNMALNRARIALFEVTDKLNLVSREEKKAKVAYDRAWNRAYLETTAKTESMKKMTASLKCEPLEDVLIPLAQAREEFTRLSNTIRSELQSLQIAANNLRQQLKI